MGKRRTRKGELTMNYKCKDLGGEEFVITVPDGTPRQEVESSPLQRCGGGE